MDRSIDNWPGLGYPKNEPGALAAPPAPGKSPGLIAQPRFVTPMGMECSHRGFHLSPVKPTNNEEHQNAGHDSGRDVPKELLHRRPLLSGGLAQSHFT